MPRKKSTNEPTIDLTGSFLEREAKIKVSLFFWLGGGFIGALTPVFFLGSYHSDNKCEVRIIQIRNEVQKNCDDKISVLISEKNELRTIIKLDDYFSKIDSLSKVNVK